MRTFPSFKAAFLALAIGAGAAASAQLLPQLPSVPSVPGVGDAADRLGRTATDALDHASRAADGLSLSPRQLLEARILRLEDVVRAAPDLLEMTRLGPATRGEVVAIDPDEATLAAVRAAGFRPIGEERIEGLEMRSVTLAVPAGWSVDRALSRLRRIAPDGEFAANHIHLQSGAAPAAALGAAALASQRAPARGRALGVIDGGVARHPAISGVEHRGFARGAPRPSAHGTAIASLAVGQGGIRGAAPGSPLLVADIYGNDPAGGSAVALVRALGWMAERRVPVVAISLVGPQNALVARAVAQARARGMHLVAAVGNDGPAAPPAFPASYPGVIAVTGVDVRNRPLIEAGRARNLDYGAPGADMAAAGADGGLVPVRGTSYAVPLVAGRLLHHSGSANPVAALDREATHRGRRGVGRGIICGECRTPHR